MALASLPFLFNTSYTIEGGNIVSTMAGEFSFSLALTSGLLFLGVFAYALRTGRLRWLAAALYGVTLLCHVVPALGYAAVAVLLALGHWKKNTWRGPRPCRRCRGPLAAFWLVPFAADLRYSSSMGYTRVTGRLVQHHALGNWLWMVIPAVLRHRCGRHQYGTERPSCSPFQRSPPWLGSSGCPQGSSTTAVGFPSTSFSWRSWPPTASARSSAWVAAGYSLTSWQAPVAIVVGERRCISGLLRARRNLDTPFSADQHQSIVPGWVAWNYTGFQGKSGWPVYQGIVRMLDQAGRTYGCGRLQYEYITETTDPFGSTEATMALPYWTDGCMDTIDGVLFESSTTTPFHFLDQAEYSLPGESSNPVSFLTYPTLTSLTASAICSSRTCATSSPCPLRTRPPPSPCPGS